MRLALELFRGEPAISRFVRHFTTYPQVIPKFCNICEFGPPRRVTVASTCPWVAHRVSGLLRATRRPIRTRFRCGSGCNSLSLATQSNSLGHSSRGTPSGILAPCGTSIALRLLVGIWFQVLFHSPSGGTFHLSLTVLVHYRSPKVFSLGEWTPQIQTGLACPVLLRNSTRDQALHCTGLSPSMVRRSRPVPATLDFVTLCLTAVEPYNVRK